MGNRQVTRSLVLSDRFGNRYIAELGVKGENVVDLMWKHITDRPFDLNSDGKIPKEKLPAVAGSEISALKWAHITDRPFDLDTGGKVPKSKLPTVNWGEIANKPFEMDTDGKIPKSVLPSFSVGVFAAQSSPPADTSLLWIDTSGGGLKYWNGGAWTAVPVAYS